MTPQTGDPQPGTLIRTNWEIRPQGGGYPIRGDLRTLPDQAPRAAVVICHGFKGFRRWGFFPGVAAAIGSRGYAAVTFDFTRNGLGNDGIDFSALDRFAENTHTRNLDEIRLVVDAVMSGKLLRHAPDRIAMIGHSRGGAEALIAAADDGRVDALVTWAAIGSFEGRWNDTQIETWEQGGTVWIANARTGQDMPIGPDYWEDVLRNRELLDPLRAASSLVAPWLIVHGEADETVPVHDARALFTAAGPEAELCLIEGGSHTFGATHPYAGPTPELRTALQTTLSWLDEQLS